MKLNPAGSAVLAGTYFGCVTCSGDAVYLAGGIALDTAGNVHFSGIAGNSLPVVNGFPPASNAGGSAPFIAELDPTLATVKFATLLNVGGAGQVATAGLVLDATGAIYVAGSTIAPTASAATSGVFQAAYGGDSGDTSSTSSAVAVTIAPAPIASTTTLVAAPTSATVGTAVAFTATVAPASGTNVPTGTVTFKDGTTTLGTATLSAGKATYTNSALALGSHSITASYAGDSGDNAQVTLAWTASSGATAPSFGQRAVQALRRYHSNNAQPHAIR